MNIYEKLLNIQRKLKAPKNQYSKFGNYYYRSLEDVVNAVKPLAEKEKAVLIITDKIELIGNRHYVAATARLYDLEGEHDFIETVAYAREEESRPKFDAAQITGSASSYARKYACNGLFAIDDNKDPDTDLGKEPPPKEDLLKKARDEMYNTAAEKGFTTDEVTRLASHFFNKKPMEFNADEVKKFKSNFTRNADKLRAKINELNGTVQ